MKKLLLSAGMAAGLMVALPQAGQAQSEWPLKSAEYVDVAGIEIDDGHMLDYANFLTSTWRKSQDFALKQGWITGYEILLNNNPRDGEPDLYLLTRFMSFPDSDEEDKRDAAYQKHMAKTIGQMEEESGGRAEYRHVTESMLLRRLVWRK